MPAATSWKPSPPQPSVDDLETSDQIINNAAKLRYS